MIKKLLERVYNLLDQILYADTRVCLETKLEGLELENDKLIDSIDECMITIEDYKEELNYLQSRRWA